MSLLEQQNVLARLFTDPAFRESFFSEPASVGQACGLDASEIDGLLALDRSEFEQFASSLMWKRFREVEKMLTLTRQVLADDFRKLFFDFASGFTPTSDKKHYEDAVAFCRYVEIGRGPAPHKDAARFDRTRLRFFAEGRSIAMCRLSRVPPFNIDDRPYSRWAPDLRVAVWLRIGDRRFHFTL